MIQILAKSTTIIIKEAGMANNRLPKDLIYSNDLPPDCIIGWKGLASVLGRSADSLKSAYCIGKLHLHLVRIGQWLFFPIKDVQFLIDKSRGDFAAE